MTGTQVLVACTVVATVVTVLGFLRVVLRAQRDREVKEALDLANKLALAKGEGFALGAASRDIEVLTLQSQNQRLTDRSIAAEKRADKAETRVEFLEDQRGRP